MAPKKSKIKQATNSGSALAVCEDLMLCILARLPLKSICRFKSVCKHWNHLLSTQEFVKMQFKLSSKFKNQFFLVHRVNRNRSNTISVFNIESNEKKAKILDHPFDYTPVGVGVGIGVSIVGCCNGLVCVERGQELVLWNPAMNLFKTPSTLKDHTYIRRESLGFGYNAEGDDFKVVRIVFLLEMQRLRKFVSCVEVYSVNSDSWTTIDPGFRFSELWFYWLDNNATVNVNGNPYWVGKVDEGGVIEKDLLICFDMSKLVFKIVPLSSLDYNMTKLDKKFVDLNGSLGALVFTWKNEEMIEYVDLNGSLDALVTTWKNEESIEYVDFWVFDDGEQIWTKSHRVGPIKVEMDRVLRILKDGRVLGKLPNGQLIVFNSDTECFEDLFNVGHDFFEIYEYTASLAYIQGRGVMH
ncbi:hypothetical protein CASFOL_027785 [Castilleja foliolosa]|uniref:F-box domain-containing protein n=1 Tax=Castilleja foliolosa TaxID=1961234 RepID=A0ABD3CGS7_9LAMI